MKKIAMTIAVASLVFTACSNGNTSANAEYGSNMDSIKSTVDSTKSIADSLPTLKTDPASLLHK